MPEPGAHPTEAAALVRLSGRLTRSLRSLIDSSPLAGLGPIEVARVLDVDKTLVSRLMSALRASDSLASLSLLPGVVPLRQFVGAAREHGAGPRAVQSAERELRAFDHELQRAFGTRTRLDAALADALPEARQRQEDTARQAVYRGMALIKGVSIDLESFTWVVHPSRKGPQRADILFLAGVLGIHRLRPTARFRIGARHEVAPPKGGAKLLRPFCRPANLSVTASSAGDYSYYEISTGSVRRDAAADLWFTEFMPGATRTIPSPREKRAVTVGDLVEHPVKRLELCLLVHEDVWPGCDFSLQAFDSTVRGMVHPPEPEREIDRLPMQAAVIRSTMNAADLRASPVRNYATILRQLMAPLGWTWEGTRGRPAFRRFRCEIAYPLHGAQVILVRE